MSNCDLTARLGLTGGAGARTPEELETLFEDTLLLGDPQALAALFEPGALFSAGEAGSARGGEAIARLALARCADGQSYVAAPECVMQARDMALIVAEQGLSVARRGTDGAWRYAIVRHGPIDDSKRRTR